MYNSSAGTTRKKDTNADLNTVAEAEIVVPVTDEFKAVGEEGGVGGTHLMGTWPAARSTNVWWWY